MYQGGGGGGGEGVQAQRPETALTIFFFFSSQLILQFTGGSNGFISDAIPLSREGREKGVKMLISIETYITA